jgi:urea transport system permease protein
VTTRKAATGLPADANIATQLRVGRDLTEDEAYALLVAAGLAPASISTDERNATLAQHLVDGVVGGVPRDQLDSEAMREKAYLGLIAAGQAPAYVPASERARLIAAHVYFDAYNEASFDITSAAKSTLSAINRRVWLNQMADLALDALSLASIYFLAAIGLAITFGVMGVINMAHGEFIMIGAYTGYVVQRFIGNYTASILVALPLAFVVSGLAGIVMERLVIRHLMRRPLETLLATFGISIALQQMAKNVFGTQARPLTAPEWLNGSLDLNDIIGISYIRIAIFVLAVVFLLLLLFILNHTRLGLEVRAVTQNRRMAASMGINPDRINMLTFALGSGIAGVAGVAIGLFAQVTSELGSNYIVQSFMAVVVGGVGNIWGTLAGASLTGIVQKIIEWFNPSNTLAAQTYMIIFIIIFIQFRPRGIIALRGRGLSHDLPFPAAFLPDLPLRPFRAGSADYHFIRGLWAWPCLNEHGQGPRQDIVPLPDCPRHGSGLGLLRHSLARAFRVFRLGGLPDWHVAHVCPDRDHCAGGHGGPGSAADA